MKLLNFIGGVLVMGAFLAIMVYFIPLAYLAITGHYLDFGGN